MKRLLGRAAACAVLCAVLLGLCACGFSYAEDDLTPYITVDTEALSRLSVTLPVAYRVDEEAVDAAVRAHLLEKKSPVNAAVQETSGTVGYGDAVAFWYCGVTGTGEKVDDGFSVGNTAPCLAEIGSGRLRVPELEVALEGIPVEDYLLETSGKVKSGATLFLQYYYVDIRDGVKGEPVVYSGVRRVPAEELDSTFGDGFAAAVSGVAMGAYTDISVTGDFGAGEVTRKYSVRVRAQAPRELTVNGTYVSDDGVHAGQTVTLYVQTSYYVNYEVPELSAETAVSLFGISAEESDPVAAYRAQVEQEVLAGEARMKVLKSEIWAALKACVEVHALPKSKVKEAKENLERELNDAYIYALENMYDGFVEAYGEASMASIDGFAVAAYGGTEGESADDVLSREAEAWVREDLIMFAVSRAGGIIPPAEEEAAGVQTIIDEFTESAGVTQEKLLKQYGGREYFAAIYLGDYVMETLCARVEVRYE